MCVKQITKYFVFAEKMHELQLHIVQTFLMHIRLYVQKKIQEKWLKYSQVIQIQND